ncbi:MAG: Ig-like domain-containing protein [Bacteroidaceae bacterium]|nr:Ig-like domain-containing protein [Bacteroidaceae bacterium]
MKKHFLILASLVLGFGQLFADNVTFDASTLWKALGGSGSQVQSVTTPYTWKTSPYYVAVTLDGSGTTQNVNTAYIPFAKGKSFTVSGTTGTTISKITFTLQQAGQKDNVGANIGSYSDLAWTPEEGTAPSSVTFTTTSTFQVKTISVEYTPGEAPDVPVVPTATMGDPIEAIAIDNISTYTGNEPYVYSKANMTYYALNNLGEYEVYGVFSEVNTLKIAGDAVSEIESLKSPNGAYINLNYIPKANSKAICTMIAETGGDWKAAYGCGYYSGGWKDRFCFFTTNATINLGGETGNRDAMRYGEKIVTVLDAAAGKMDIFEADGTTLIGTITDSPKTADCKTPLYVFAQNKDVPGGGTQTDCYNPLVTIYGLQLYEGETLVMDLVPAVNGEGKGGLKDKLTDTFYGSANSADFELSADGQAMAGAAGISVYEGKRVKLTTDNHEYKYQGGQWLDCGEMALEEIKDTDPSYKDMRNWKTNDGHMSIFAGFTYDGTTNEINPYVGTGGHEPYMFQIPTIAGEDYNWSFIYSGSEYDSWHSTPFHAYVANDYNLNTTETGASYNSNVIGIAEAFPFAGVENKPYSIDFTAKQNNETLVVQFGDANDGKEFWFKFASLKVSKYVYPLPYEQIDFIAQDDNKYTPLAYIESTGAARENAFTTTYVAKASTEVDIKFNLYSNNGWAAVFSGRNGSDASTGISLYKNGGADKFGYFVGGYRNDDFADFPGFNQDITVEASLSGLVVNGGEKVVTNQTSFSSSTRGISMFANPEWDNPIRGRIYYMTLKEDGTTIYDFQPVMRHDGAFGYYDRKTATFVQPARGSYDGYSFAKLDDQAYMTYAADTRIVMVGSTAQFLPDVQNLDGATFTWTSADETIATVAADGTVTGVKAGKVMITVTTDADQGWTASYELTVSEPNYVRKDVNNVGYAVVTGGNGWGDSPVANLVDNDATTKFGCSGGGDAWAIIIASEPVAVQQYSFVTGGDTYDNPGRTPRDWKLEGSNDNQTWTVIDQQEQNYKAKTANKEQTVFTVNGTDTYKFFKFTAGNFNGGFQLGELWINEQAHTWGEPTEIASTCTVEGKKVWECTDCKALKTERLPLAAHTYENNVCTVCNAKVAEPILLANGQANDYIVKFRHKTGSENDRNIEEGWNTADFDDSAWDELVMPIGTAGYGVQHTIWQNEYNTFWFRRNFYVENPAAITKLTLKALHDDDYAIYVNGTQIEEAGGWTNGTEWLELNVDPSLLVAGNNVVAVYIEQNWGGAYCDFYLEGNAGATIKVSDAGYATFVAPCDVDFNGSAATANAATFDGTYVQLAPVTTVPAGTAVVVKAEEGTYTVPATTNAVLGATNELVAATADVATDGTQYILAKAEEGVGFYKATGTIAAGKGYLVIGAPVKGFYGFDADDATGIKGIDFAGENAPVYNLAGQRLSKAQKGVNIIGGKKIAVK